ncbi:MAG: NTP transferase domain-containing protein [Candidatus Omnitrophica bacterium]|nr:NTP transferase domain-containing protein [Candidatus Omnitrophota bacterium]
MKSKKSRKLAVIILAAGRGTRLKSDGPKALQTVCGQPMLGALLEETAALKPEKTLVVAGYRFDQVRDYLGKRATLVHQKELLGSGHAVARTQMALSGFKGLTLVLYCDTPLISIDTLLAMRRAHEASGAVCTLLSVNTPHPAGYGRIKRSKTGSVERVIEENDASPEEKAIQEVNVGCYFFEGQGLFRALKKVRQNPKKKEYYLTDAVGILAGQGPVEAWTTRNTEETLGVNTRQELAAIEALMEKRLLERFLEAGVRIRDPKTTWVDADVQIGEDTVVLPHTVIEEGAVIGRRCVIGPFARIRGGSKVADEAVIGNFVELVRSTIGKKSMVKHLSYLGDAQVGSSVNIGAGTITANFDGKKKYKTIIKDGAQIGSGTVLVAPVVVGRGAATGAGAVVTKNKRIPDRAVFVGIPAKQLSTKSETRSTKQIQN